MHRPEVPDLCPFSSNPRQEFHETLHSLLLWLAHAESRRYAVDIHHPDTPPGTLLEHRNTLTVREGSGRRHRGRGRGRENAGGGRMGRMDKGGGGRGKRKGVWGGRGDGSGQGVV